MVDHSTAIQAQVTAAYQERQALRIVGNDSKSFYGRTVDGQELNLSQHTGIVSYEPTELVVTARAGTTLTEIQQVLAEKGQELAFEPPLFAANASLGGCIACGFSGPARPYVGAARDFVLGLKCINGKGEILNFGGQVMKNVAGYDVSRLMVGALGGLGVLLEISCKVLPIPEETVTLVLEMDLPTALAKMLELGNQPLPLTASCFDGQKLYIRLSGTAIHNAQKRIGGEVYPNGQDFWFKLKEQQLPFFQQPGNLWRISLPMNSPDLALGDSLIEWGGALRWLRSDMDASHIRQKVTQFGGHAVLFRGSIEDEIFHPLPDALFALHKRLKQQFDPAFILNPNKMYLGL